MLKIKKNQGITLVALIITIIILLILAGITIGQLTGNGIFENAKTAKEKYENAQELENSILSDYEKELVGGTRDDEITALKARIKQLEDNSVNYATKQELNNITYSKTIAQPVGTWINGETIYMKVFEFNNNDIIYNSTNHQFTFDTGIYASKVIKIEGGIYRKNGILIPFNMNNDESPKWNNAFWTNLSDGKIEIGFITQEYYNASNIGDTMSYAIIYYLQ